MRFEPKSRKHDAIKKLLCTVRVNVLLIPNVQSFLKLMSLFVHQIRYSVP